MLTEGIDLCLIYFAGRSTSEGSSNHLYTRYRIHELELELQRVGYECVLTDVSPCRLSNAVLISTSTGTSFVVEII